MLDCIIAQKIKVSIIYVKWLKYLDVKNLRIKQKKKIEKRNIYNFKKIELLKSIIIRKYIN